MRTVAPIVAPPREQRRKWAGRLHPSLFAAAAAVLLLHRAHAARARTGRSPPSSTRPVPLTLRSESQCGQVCAGSTGAGFSLSLSAALPPRTPTRPRIRYVEQLARTLCVSTRRRPTAEARVAGCCCLATTWPSAHGNEVAIALSLARPPRCLASDVLHVIVRTAIQAARAVPGEGPRQKRALLVAAACQPPGPHM